MRFAVLQYFARSYSKIPTIMPDVIGLVERLGPKDAFRYSFPISDLAQTDETITWAVNWLQRNPTAEDEDFLSHIGRLLCHADPMLVLPHKAAILSAPGLDRQLAVCVEHRLGLISTPSDQLWQQLEAICEAGQGKMHANEISIADAKDITEALARDVSQRDRMLELLKQEFDPDSETPLIWLEIFLVQMAGHMRSESAIPLIIDKFLVDGEILNEECDTALTKIGTDAVIRACAMRTRRPPTISGSMRRRSSGTSIRIWHYRPAWNSYPWNSTSIRERGWRPPSSISSRPRLSTPLERY